MAKLFVDSSVLFAAAYSTTGAARDLVTMGIEKRVHLAVSDDVVVEVRRNFTAKYPDRLAVVAFFFDNAAFEITESPTYDEVRRAAQYTVLKDAPIVAAAIKANCTHLITYDRKHLIDPPEVRQRSGLDILTPADAIDQINLI